MYRRHWIAVAATSFVLSHFHVMAQPEKPAAPEPPSSTSLNTAVNKAKQALRDTQRNGIWYFMNTPVPTENEVGATSLAALALIEAGVGVNDQAINAAALYVRNAASGNLTSTYAVTSAILFLDRVNVNGGDKELIQKLGRKVISSQQNDGGWTYLVLDGPGTSKSDNSNTQFAILALWVLGDKYQMPVTPALKRLESRFRKSQARDGGWNYGLGENDPSTCSMTCVGLLALAVSHVHAMKEINLRAEKAGGEGGAPGQGVEFFNDRQVTAGFQFLANALKNGDMFKPPHTYYALWSLERVCIAYDKREEILGVRWFDLGAAYLIANQGADGSWRADYAGPVDTSFGLFFLLRANLLPRFNISGTVGLRGGAVGDPTVKKNVKMPDPELEAKRAAEKAAQLAALNKAKKLRDELLEAPAAGFEDLVTKIAASRETEATGAIAEAIPKLATAPMRNAARTALADRLSKLSSTQIKLLLLDPDKELRRAAASACAAKNKKEVVMALVTALDDKEPLVAATALEVLKEMSGKDFGMDVPRWKAWAERVAQQ